MRIALLPGTFDPPTLGHLDIIHRASGLFDELFIGIAENVNKKGCLFPLDERKEMLRRICIDIRNVRIVRFNGLVVDYAKANKIRYLVRGLRTYSDLEYETQMAVANRMMEGVDTVFLIADARHAHISSTLIREIGLFGHRLHGFVPGEIEDLVFQKLSRL